MLVKFNDPILHNTCSKFNFEDPVIAPEEIAEKLMVQKMVLNGYGLAAPQIGLSLRVFAFLEEVAFNPTILDYSSDWELAVEGCLSYPGLWIQVKRPEKVKVSYFNEKGNHNERWLDVLESRIFQHESDHLEGLTFTDAASDLKLRRAIEQAGKHGYNYSYKELRDTEIL